MKSKVYNKCPICGKVNKHVWDGILKKSEGYFVVICECENIYLQAIV